MKEFEKWFKKAEGDLMIIQNIVLLPDSPYDLCCFHAQQASEKYLKAFLIANQIDFPKTHDLVELNKLCSHKNIKFTEIKLLCAKLKNYSIAPRYPDEMDDLTLEDAQQAYQNALAIKEFITKHFFE